ncbi:TetR/AcrR family transcriptional regulator [Microbacterium sp. KUDC0406]|uniref:TetR/AcrR family transcriptional regulator n=1 Tax=Microbacterium sp. KUDC0406 TaxID=2909588 RepID=UPI001F2D4D8F|nr:TetR/AcrR family transcriptional regulator [Microbacterium sp. KUDC0406]UJP10950.1 TetR/AcrR family transcriptional regulator [Microbacterium sp. KUDC0406]
MTSMSTARDRAKAERTDALLEAAARLFAERGYSGVSLEDIGSAVGVSGPAVYRHFPGKQALLGAVLAQVSADLVSGGTEVSDRASDAQDRMRALIRFHVEFALGNADVIRVQDRDVAHLSDADRAEVRRLQRTYIDLWIAALSELRSGTAEDQRLRVQACFGLINSTPHSTRSSARAHAETAGVLSAMAISALLADSTTGQ